MASHQNNSIMVVIQAAISCFLLFHFAESANFENCKDRRCTSCKAGWYGEKCEFMCGNCEDDRRCNKDSGYCNSNSCQPGYFGRNCTSQCHRNCYEKKCDFNTGKCMKCTDSYYGEFCNTKCPNNCLSCTTATNCSSCEIGWYGSYCSFNCSNCGGSGMCNKADGRCISHPCQIRYFGSRCNKRCSDKCGGNGSCNTPDGTCKSGCKPGHWKSKCDQTCSSNCGGDGSCSFRNGSCNTGCKPGFWGQKCYEPCSINCGSDKSCNIYNATCSKGCKPGHWGQTCYEPCHSNCGGDGSCSFRNGSCSTGCKPGFWGLNCYQRCLSNCGGDGSCNFHNATCSKGCKPGHYGQKCDQICSLNCGVDRSCNFLNGSCSKGCKPRSWGQKCDQSCPLKCGGDGSCKQHSKICKEGCRVGYMGSFCNESCPSNCKNKSCNRNTGNCSHNCTDGWFGLQCRKACPIHCGKDRSCERSSGKCSNDCKEEWFGMYCNKSCPVNCADRKCNRLSGECQNNCKEKWFGMYCNKMCPVNCADSKCNRLSGKCSNDCKEEWFGTYCNKSCPVNCADRKCNRSSGECPNDCKEGLFGMYCNKSCPINCANRKCNKSSGECSNDCKKEWFGMYCNKSCPVNCADRKCNRLSGECSNDCKEEWFGMHCNKSCPVNCADRKCNRLSGECPNDCKEKWFGMYCNTSCPMNCADRKCNRSSGECFNECKEGWFGQHCNKSCPGNCADGSCKKLDGTCIKECTTAFYGVQCTLDCPLNCYGDRSCHKESGICNYGCTPGWNGSHCRSECEFPKFGNFCMENCGKCRDQSCHHINGTCMLGCEAGWLNKYCDVENTADVMDSSAVVLIVLAVIILIFTIVVVLVFLRKRDYSKEKANKASETDGVELIAGSDTVEDDLGALSQTGDTAEQGTAYLVTIDDHERIYCNTDDTMNGIPVSQLKAYFTANRQKKKFEDEFKALPHGSVHPTTVAELPKNMKKNRYKNTLPYDHSRVRLQGKMDFINANFIEDASGIKKYIAAQGPIQTTIEDFWQMIWESNIDKIVMLTNLVEGGKKKCEQYWPNPNEKMTLGKFGLTLKDERTFSYYTLREVEMVDNKSKEKRDILHNHFTTWPDHGTPDPLLLILFHKRVIATKPKYDGPILVHCSAGIGRTGTFIALDALESQGANTGIVDIENYVRIMRKDRLNMIQTSEQYKVLHEALVEVFQWQDTSISMDEFPSVWKSIDSDNSPINQQHLKKEYDKLLEMKTLRGEETSITALKEENKLKNRTANILPLDKYRPYLTSHLRGKNDYINSVIIPTQISIEAFMVTQVPLQGTIVDFWRLISDTDSRCIVYFASSSDEEISFFPASDNSTETEMHLIQKESITSILEGVEELKLIVKNKENNQTADVLMLKMNMAGRSFPSASHIFRAAEVVELQRRRFKNSPCTIVSLDGCSPCEVFCAFSDVIEYMKVDNRIDVFQTARQLQIRRPEFFGKFETYRYCYQIINEYLMTQSVYCNT